jgi:GDP-L-fucose synthase
MNKSSKIYIAGHRGLAGSAIWRKLEAEGFTNLVGRTSKELDLRNGGQVDEFFASEKPEYIFFAAGKVGGILANNTYPADFIYDNVMMIFNTVHAAYKNKVKKLLYLGSTCMYPKFSPQPIKEEYLLTGELEETNKPYAIAKIAGIELCRSFNRQFGTQYISLVPTNLFGINDSYDPHNSHFLPALIRKFYEAQAQGKPYVELWGTGKPGREILCSDSLADACVYFMDNYSGNEIINIGSGKEQTITEWAQMIKEIVGYKGEIKYDTSKPDGTPQRISDISRAAELGWKPQNNLKEDLKRVYEDFAKNYQALTNK